MEKYFKEIHYTAEDIAAGKYECPDGVVCLSDVMAIYFLSIHLTQLLVTSDLKRQIGAFTAASARRSKRVS